MSRACTRQDNTRLKRERDEGRGRYTCKSGLLDDAAAGIVREGRRGGDASLSLLPQLPVPLVMMARHPRAPGLLVL